MGLSIMVDMVKLPASVRAYFQAQGKIGAAKRLEVITPERRSEIARAAAMTRWANRAEKTDSIKRQAKKGAK